MEFEDEDREEEEEEEEEQDDEDEEETMNLLTPYKTSHKKVSSGIPRYRECLKNHAVGIGGHAIDGCGEFMPAGPDRTLDALKCAACNCHRNFHRKEHLLIDNHHHHHNHQLTIFTPRQHLIHPPQPPPQPPPPNPQPPQVFQFYPYNRTTASPSPTTSRPLALTSPAGDAEDRLAGGMMTMTMTSSSGKKRHRTKFSQEQKDKMLELAEKIGWRIQKQDESIVQQFCDESGVKRHVLKVWMHNNKHALGKKLPNLVIDSNVPDN